MNPPVDRALSNKEVSNPKIKMAKSTLLNRTNSTISHRFGEYCIRVCSNLGALIKIIVLAEVQP